MAREPWRVGGDGGHLGLDLRWTAAKQRLWKGRFAAAGVLNNSKLRLQKPSVRPSPLT